MSVFLLILGIVLFIGLVVIHEFGHFIAARRDGVEVEEFGIGFPPKIWGKQVKTKNSSFEFTINALPLGGFVRLKGENDAATEKGTFGAASIGTKIRVMIAGVIMNLITAFVLFTLLALIGMPKLIDNQFTVKDDTEITRRTSVTITDVSKDQPAEKAGLQKDDKIVSFAGQELEHSGQINSAVKQNTGKTVPIIVERNGQPQQLQVTINNESKIGIATSQEGIQLQRSTWSAPVVAGGLIKQLTELTFKGIGTAFSSLAKGDTKTASEQVSGPVGIAVLLKEGSKLGINFVLFIIAIISLSLAIMNVLPIPALDGGRLFVLLLFRALKKPLTKEREELIHGVGFMALMGLFVLITIVDVRRFF